MEEDDVLTQMEDDDLWMNAIKFDPFDLVGMPPTAELTWEHYEKRQKDLSRTLHPDKISIFYCENETVLLSDLPWPRQHHVNLLRGYVQPFGELPRSHFHENEPYQNEIDDGIVDDMGAWKNEKGRQLFPYLTAYSPSNNPRHNLEHSREYTSSIRASMGPSPAHDLDRPYDCRDAASPHPGVSHMPFQTGPPNLEDNSQQGRRGESAKRPIHLAPHRGGWHPRMVARPDRPAALKCFGPKIIPRKESMVRRLFHDETGFVNQVLHPFEYRDAKIKSVRVKLADIFVGTVPAAMGTSAAVYASWTAKGCRFRVPGPSPGGNKVALLKTTSSRRERAVPFEEIHLEGGWVGATEDWIRFRTWKLQPRGTRMLL
ncbi:hypothetical protein LTR43_011430 [Exophiala xenobiotica]|nr:hypothetical protein LTR55_011245 [Exophiala xenobiotica]